MQTKRAYIFCVLACNHYSHAMHELDVVLNGRDIGEPKRFALKLTLVNDAWIQ